MKKKFCIALVLALALILSLGTAVLADDPTEGTVSVSMSGNDFDFGIWTQTADVQDSFIGESDGSLEVVQTVRFQPSGQWTSDAPDIDRFGEFYGIGSLETTSQYNSSAQYSWGESLTRYFVESDTRGILSQNLHFDGGWGGVKDVDQYKKQRNAELYAEGNYSMSLFCVDKRADPSNYGFRFDAVDSGSWGNLFLNTMQTTTEHGGGQWHVYDKLITDFVYTYEGSPGVDVSFLANRGGDIDVTIDLITKFVSGIGIVW